MFARINLLLEHRGFKAGDTIQAPLKRIKVVPKKKLAVGILRNGGY